MLAGRKDARTALEDLMLRPQRAEMVRVPPKAIQRSRTRSGLRLGLGFFDRLQRRTAARTKQQIVGRFDEIVQQADTAEQRTRPVDVDTIEALEELLVSADVGIAATERIVGAVKATQPPR